ncbi:MAG TPA: HAMP domain-containing sensor histidine kinase, partial [Saprospiraceae bacterium]|nr:HAMP domain-containing sensor histidine kinase [Saprospiraceae bacterium]
NQVLDLEKIQGESGAPPPGNLVDMDALVNRTAAGMEQLFREKEVAFYFNNDSHDNCEVPGDHDRLVQVVTNLLSNALKFAPQGNGEVTASLHRQHGLLVLRIQDNGPGIPPEKQDLIFEKFTQLSRRETGKPEGSGLGLFITKTIVEQHGGSVRVQSRVGEGATFEVRLPLQ